MASINLVTNIDNTRLYNPPFTAGLIGSTRSGKTTFLNHYVPKIADKYDLIILFSNSSHSDAYDPIKKIKDKLIVFDSFIPEIIMQLEYLQKNTDNLLQILIILDDEIDSKNQQTLIKLFCVLRNSNFSTIFSGQEYTMLSKQARNNMNYCFIFKQNSISSYEAIYKMFLYGVLEERLGLSKDLKKYQITKACIDFMRAATSDHNILFLNILDDFQINILSKNYVKF